MTQPKCVECKTVVDPDAERCPHCGFNPDAHWKYQRGWALLGGLFIFPIITLPLTFWCFWMSYKHQRKRQRGVTGVENTTG